jgi:N-acetylmuramoyl-L-alanine amidase
MRKNIAIGLRILLFIAILTLSLEAADKKPISYINLKPLAEKYELKHERDPITGREIFSGNGTKLIVCSGMMTVLINNQVSMLEDRAKTINGEIAIPAGDIEKLEIKIKESHSEHVKKEYGIKKVVIDPGHGGTFKGAQGVSGVLEKAINLSIAFKLKALLEAKDIKVILTRERDTSLSANLSEDLDRRVAIANREQPDLFISIHCNWSNQSSAHGFEIYYSSKKPLPTPKLNSSSQTDNFKVDSSTRKMLSYALREEYQKETLEVSKEVKKQFNELDVNDRGIRDADFRVIKKTEMPAILVELDYLSNKKMCRELEDDSYQCKLAQKLADAIMNYHEKISSAQGPGK